MCHPEVPAGQETPQVSREEVLVPVEGGAKMPALLTRPEGGEGPGVLIINDIFGRSPFYENLAARLATAGYVALLPEYFFELDKVQPGDREGAQARRAKLDEQLTVRRLNQAIDWLKQQQGVRGQRTGTVGFCMGGTFILNLAAERSDLASVCFYGFPAGAKKPSGAPTPPLEQVDRIKGPIIGFWGDQDTGVGIENVEKLAAAMKERGVDFKHTIYPGLGHGFLAASRLDPDHEAYEKACDAWTKAVEFYRQHLGATQGVGA